MKPIYVHACGDTLEKLVERIRNAIFASIYNKYHAGVHPDALPHFWYVHQGWFEKPIHPAICAALREGPPKDLHQLVLEAPHVSTDDRIAYTQSDQKGRRNLQTVTTPGKYLKRHFPQFKDDQIRGLAECKIGCRIIYTMPEMLFAINNGPHSCMKLGEQKPNMHPYESYDPKYGWAMAINEESREIHGRALVHLPSKTFVRTYRKIGSAISSCNLMQDWLKQQGFEHAKNWPNGTLIRRLENAPYLDGDHHCADKDYNGSEAVWCISNVGEYCLNQTDGQVARSDDDDDDEAEADSYMGNCDDCGDSLHEDDGYGYSGEDAERQICHFCMVNYTEVIGSRGNTYRIHDSYVQEVKNIAYDREYLSDQENLCFTVDSEWAERDDCFYCSIDGEYYLHDQEDCVELDDGDSAAACNAWQCEISLKWYAGINEKLVLVDGRIVHSDCAWQDDLTDIWYGSDELHRRVTLDDGTRIYQPNTTEENHELLEENA